MFILNTNVHMENKWINILKLKPYKSHQFKKPNMYKNKHPNISQHNESDKEVGQR